MRVLDMEFDRTSAIVLLTRRLVYESLHIPLGVYPGPQLGSRDANSVPLSTH